MSDVYKAMAEKYAIQQIEEQKLSTITLHLEIVNTILRWISLKLDECNIFRIMSHHNKKDVSILLNERAL